MFEEQYNIVHVQRKIANVNLNKLSVYFISSIVISRIGKKM